MSALIVLVAIAVTARGLSGAGRAQASPPSCQSSGSGVLFVYTRARHTRPLQAQACATGSLLVQFHSTRAGCAARRPCGVSGVETFTPAAEGELFALAVRDRGALRIVNGGLLVGGANPVRSVVITARPGAPAATCRDAFDFFGSFALAVRHGLARFGISADAPLLASQCSSPLDRDVANALPHATLPASVLTAGPATIDLAGVHTFASRDFAGTVSSTVVVTTGRLRVQASRHGPFPGPAMRSVDERYAVPRIAGRLRVAVAGTREPARCRRLDACGQTGTIRLTFRGGAGGEVDLSALGPRRRPLADFLAAVGRGPGNPKSIHVGGGGSVPTRGTVLARVDGPRGCTDQLASGTALLELSVASGRLRVALISGPTGDDLLRTRCPGPALGTRTLAAGSIPVTALDADAVSLVLHGRTLTDGPYTLRASGTVQMTLRRRSQRIQTFP